MDFRFFRHFVIQLNFREMRIILAVCLPVICMCFACDSELVTDKVTGESKLVLYCIPSNTSDTTFIQLLWSKPLNGNQVSERSIAGTMISFCLNGEERAIESADKLAGHRPENTFYTVGTLKEGDEIEVRVSCPGIPVITARTIIPSAFPLEKVEGFSKAILGKTAVGFRITFQDCATTKDYYGIKILCKTLPEESTQREACQSTVKSLALNVESEPLMNDKFEVDDIFYLSNYYYRNLYIYEDEKISGQTYTLNFDFMAQNTSTSVSGKVFYKVVLFTLSKELYKYLWSVNRLNNNELGKVGLAPIYKKYTNVVNGVGIVGACNIYETEWMDASLFCK